MTWATILLSGWLTVAWVPNGQVDLYSNPIPEFVTIDGSFYTELGVEATWGVFFAGGSIKTPVWHMEGVGLNFWPTQAEYSVDVGAKWENVRLGFTHTCYHAVVPGLSAVQWYGRQIVPAWEGSQDVLYLTIGKKP